MIWARGSLIGKSEGVEQRDGRGTGGVTSKPGADDARVGGLPFPFRLPKSAEFRYGTDVVVARPSPGEITRFRTGARRPPRCLFEGRPRLLSYTLRACRYLASAVTFELRVTKRSVIWRIRGVGPGPCSSLDLWRRSVAAAAAPARDGNDQWLDVSLVRFVRNWRRFCA